MFVSEQSSEIWGCQLTDDEDGFDVCFVDKSVSGIWYALLISSGVLGFITGLFYLDLFGGFCFGLVCLLIAFVFFICGSQNNPVMPFRCGCIRMRCKWKT